jgi:hypothetical protein
MYPRRSGSKTSKYRRMDVGKRLAISKLVITRKKSTAGQGRGNVNARQIRQEHRNITHEYS